MDVFRFGGTSSLHRTDSSPQTGQAAPASTRASRDAAPALATRRVELLRA